MKEIVGLTYAAEGSSDPGSPYYSRRPHVPSDRSGVTIGRGYDLSHRTQAEAFADLRAAGMEEAPARTLSRAAGLRGTEARAFLRNNPLLEISAEAEAELFSATLSQKASEAKRICQKPDVERIYGKTNWETLDPAIKEVLVDLTYRGDYTARTRHMLQPAIAANNLPLFRILLSDRNSWAQVPLERFRRRIEFLRGG